MLSHELPQMCIYMEAEQWYPDTNSAPSFQQKLLCSNPKETITLARLDLGRVPLYPPFRGIPIYDAHYQQVSHTISSRAVVTDSV
jgi:hypothetical protein